MRFGGFNRYRNATTTLPGREAWYSELSLDADVSLGSNGLAVDASRLYVKAANGNALQALAVGQTGKLGQQAAALPGHTEKLVDWSTSYFEDGRVIGGDAQGVVSLWKDGCAESTFTAHTTACITVAFHPTVAGILATSSSTEVKLWDANSNTSSEPIWSCGVEGRVDSVSVRGDGQLIAASTHTGVCAVHDPRQQASNGSLAGLTSVFHASGRPTRVLWLGERPFFISTGLTKMRERSAALWDQRNLSKPLASLLLQASTKPLIPLYDEDTQLAYLVEKGDNIVRWLDADPSSPKPLTEFGSVALPSQISGGALLPKRRLDVMSGEIARIHVLVENAGAGAGSAVVPISHVAPRRSYLDFHADLFPDTRAPLPAQTLAQWKAQDPVSVPRMSLDPAKTADSLASLRRLYSAQQSADDAGSGVTGGSANSLAKPQLEPQPSSRSQPLSAEFVQQATKPSPGSEALMPKDSKNPALDEETGSAYVAQSKVERSPSADKRVEVAKPAEEASNSNVVSDIAPLISATKQVATATATATKRRQFVQPDHARFKYLEGFLYHPNEHFSSLHDINVRFPQENDPMKASPRFIAIATAGTGGQVGILQRNSPGRVPAKLPTIVHGATVVDIQFDPFDPAVLATAGTDSKLYLWRIPSSTLTEETSFDLDEYIHVTADRIHQIRFHPCAKNIIAVLVSDGSESAVYVYHGLMLHFIVGKTSDGIHSFAWSPDGARVAITTKKTRRLRIYSVLSQELLCEGPSMDSIRPCRIAWIDNGRLCLAGFGIGSQRMLAVYSVSDLSRPRAKKTIDVGPGILAPVVDMDCSIIYLDDRGSRLTHAFELVGDNLVDLPKYESSQPSLCLAVLPKVYADVAKCELARAYRLNAQTIESMGFRVPRKRPEYFQDEIFPDTVDRETPFIDAISWIGGTMPTPRFISLCPPGMAPLSEAPPETARRPKAVLATQQDFDNTKDAISAMLSKVDIVDNEEPDHGSGSDWDD